jgi:ligand-binding SRPBCC domain-containing protein
MTSIHLETRIEAPIERVFDLARDIGLHARSMAATGEQAIAGRRDGPIELGETVTWRAKHFGRWWTLTSRITLLQRPARFEDVQAAGPFRSFRHRHTFRAVDGGTVMTDDWQHMAPFGPLGWLADRVVLGRHIRHLLETRNAQLKAEAEAEGETPQVGRRNT